MKSGATKLTAWIVLATMALACSGPMPAAACERRSGDEQAPAAVMAPDAEFPFAEAGLLAEAHFAARLAALLPILLPLVTAPVGDELSPPPVDGGARAMRVSSGACSPPPSRGRWRSAPWSSARRCPQAREKNPRPGPTRMRPFPSRRGIPPSPPAGGRPRLRAGRRAAGPGIRGLPLMVRQQAAPRLHFTLE